MAGFYPARTGPEGSPRLSGIGYHDDLTSMQTSLCLLVKDEENTLTECLSPIRDLFDDVVVMDTGSTDRTRELLQERFGITPHRGTLEERLCYSKCDARNQAPVPCPAPLGAGSGCR